MGSARQTFWTDNQTTALLRSTIDRFDDVDQLLLVLQYPVELVVVARPKIAHHVFIPEEEHERDGIIELIHLLKVRDLIEIADVDDGEVLDAVGDAVEHFVLSHAVWVPVSTEADDDQALFRGQNGLGDMPSCNQVR